MDRGGLLMVRELKTFGVGVRILAVLAWLVTCGLAVSASAVAACSNAGLRVGASAGLPDCRAFEQVSPVDKGGFSGDAVATPARVSVSGDAISYLSNQAFPGAMGNTALFAGHVSSRSAASWKTTEWTPEVTEPAVLKAYAVNYAFGEDLSEGVLKVSVIPLTPEATPNAYNLYIRHPDGSYSLVNAALPAMSEEEICGPGALWVCWQFADVPAFAGASSDFSHVMFESNAQLLPGAPETFSEGLYESFEEHVKLVGILPDGQPATSSTAGAGSVAGAVDTEPTADRRVEHAVSSDGSRAVFQAPSDEGEPNENGQADMTEVYDRINGSETVELSAPVAGATPAVSTARPATFWAASVDGSKVFFSSSAELTTESNTGTANGGEDLYEYELETGHLTDLTVDTNPEDAANGAMVQGVVDVSSDGSYVYLVADGVLDPGKGVDGQPNLYVIHNGGEPMFIATLSSTGTCDFHITSQSADSCDWTPYPVELEAYVAPDGRHMAFMSTMSLPTVNFPSGYDNANRSSGEDNSEVYEYTAPATEEGQGELVCVSCDSSGAPPVGNALLGGMADAAPTPQIGLFKYDGISTPFYRARAMSDSGTRVFYTAPASRSAPFERVYEFERDGEGECDMAQGCRYMLSSAGGEADQFLGASSDGADVYLTTTSPLVTTDIDSLRDVYDARVDGGIPIPTEAGCESNCRQAAGAPLTQPAVSVSSGPSGNIPASAPSKGTPKKKCAKNRKLSHGRCVKKKRKATKNARKTNAKRRVR